MRLGRATMLAAVVWVLGLPGQLVGQDDFLDRYRAAVRLLQDREATARARAQAFDRALSAFLRISEAAPGYRQRVELGAYCAAQAGKHRMAAQLYERAWELGQRTAGVLEARLRAMVTGGDLTAAVMLAHGVRDQHAEALAALLVDHQLYLPFVQGAAGLLRQGDLGPGLWLFQRQAQLLPQDPYAQSNLGLTLRHLGRPTAARAAYERAVRLLPRSDIANDQGLALKGAGDHQAAAAALLRSLELQEVAGQGAAATNLGVLLQRTGIRARPDPLADLRARLRQEPRKPLARRVTLDLLAREAAAGKSIAAGRGGKPGE